MICLTPRLLNPACKAWGRMLSDQHNESILTDYKITARKHFHPFMVLW